MEEYEISLGDYIRILWKEKWAVIITFVVAVVLALVVSIATPRQYQVQTALLILPPLYQDIGGQLTGTVLSPESYKSLALANDLLEKVILIANIQNKNFTPDRLQKQMKVDIEPATAKQPPFFLRITFTSSDREDLVKLAEVWTQIFAEEYSQLLTAYKTQVLDSVTATMAEVERELRAKQEELKVFLQENPETVIQAEVDALRAKYLDYLKSLADAEKQLAAAQAKVNALAESLAKEPEFFVVARSPSDEAIWQFLGARPDTRALASFTDLTLSDQVLNTTYVDLRRELALAQAELASLQAFVSYYQEVLARISEELAEKQAKLLEIQVKRGQLEQEISVLKDTYNRVAKSLQEAKIARAETAEPIRIVERPVFPTIPIGPSRTLNVAVAGVLGLFVGILLAFVVHYFREEEPTPGEEKREPNEPSANSTGV